MTRQSTPTSNSNRLAPTGAEPTGGVYEWRRHPRLQRHLQRFHNHPQQPAVLERYWKHATELDKTLLFRYTTHVAAWVALLPHDTASLPECVRLLGSLLGRCGRAKFPPWLHGTLHLVALRLKALSCGPHDKLAEPWSVLKQSLPRRVWKSLRSQCPSVPAGKSAGTKSSQAAGVSAFPWREDDAVLVEHPLENNEACAAHHTPMKLKEVRRLQETRQTELIGVHGKFKDEEIEAVARRASDALAACDAEWMLKAVVDVVALLSPPREAKREQGVAMTERAKKELRAANQARLRRALLRLLGVEGRGGLDLSEPGTRKLLHISLERLRGLLQDRSLDRLLCAEQWIAIAGAIGIPASRQGAMPQDSSSRVSLPAKRKVTNPGIHKIMSLALERLGGEATSHELRQEIARMPESSALNAEIVKRPSSCKRPLWEDTVARDCSRIFDPMVDTVGKPVKRGGLKVWREGQRNPRGHKKSKRKLVCE